MSRFTFVILLFVFSCFILSCRKKDNTKPFFEISSPSDADTFLIESNIYFNATFHDDLDLSQYRIIIKNNFTVGTDSFPAWNTVMVNDLNGKEETINMEIQIPDSISIGPYFFIVKAVDLAGNESAADTTEIIIQ